MNRRWKQLGGQAGIALSVLGFLLIFLGWNGAATYDRVPSQFPYLVSGGIAGLGVVVVGAALIVVNAQRQDRAALLNSLAELKEVMERVSLAVAAGSNGSGAASRAGDGLVAAGPSAYHRPDCRLLEGRGALPLVPVEVARERGLAACRACDAADVTPSPPGDEEKPPRPRRRSARA